ncbi:MAG: stage II sporulation protein M [Deltaproteobacteria bacterium]|jgi:uncharacterized membrane protein SpoIIM required for sporulation|nr:stage II sporulation protein M [Deltaproteobacteria bacterium]
MNQILAPYQQPTPNSSGFKPNTNQTITSLKDNSPERKTLRSAQFRKNREKSWAQLEMIVEKLEKRGLGALSAQEAMDLPILYQAQISSLAVARNTILDQNLLAYLENLSLRSYISVYAPRTPFLQYIKNFILIDFPKAVRGLKWPLLISFLIMFSALFASTLMVLRHNDYFELFVEAESSQGRDFSSTAEELKQSELFPPFEGFEKTFVYFGNFLFRHNAKISLLCFGLGIVFGVPTILILIYNGLALGAMIALHLEKGLGLDFIGWVSIHGVTEILALLIAAAAGLSLGNQALRPGRGGRLASLNRQSRQSVRAIMGAVIMLFAASILEGGFRQLISFTGGRLFIALLTAVFWAFYFLKAGRKK